MAGSCTEVRGRGPVPATVTVNGGRNLSGQVRVAGFKHALVTTMAAAVVGRGPVTLENCPDIEETRILAALLTHMGARVTMRGSVLELDAAPMRTGFLQPALVGQIHGSIYLLPGLLSRFGSVRMPLAGGCRIGAGPSGERPIRQYAAVLERFGARVTIAPSGALDVCADQLQGCEIDLRDYTADRTRRTGPLYSGATKMAILTAAAAHGRTRLLHPYPKPDVTELVAVLAAMGCEVRYVSGRELVIDSDGPAALTQPVRHMLVTDIIEVVTWATVAACTASVLRLSGLTLDRLGTGIAPELKVGRQIGLGYTIDGPDSVLLHPDPPCASADVTVSSHGVYSDSQPFLTLLATFAPGVSRIRDTVWTHRFSYVEGLNKMGTCIDVRGAEAHVTGGRPPSRSPGTVVATDLRAAAVLLLAALRVPGTTQVSGAAHLSRGYEDLVRRLNALGAEIHIDETVTDGGAA